MRTFVALAAMAALVIIASGRETVWVEGFQSSSFQSRSRGTTSLSMSLPGPLDTLTSGLASICRLPRGVTAVDLPQETIQYLPRIVELYDIENSAACRTVRELITELDLVVENVIPATEDSQVFNQQGKFNLPKGALIPRMVIADYQSGVEETLMGEEDIVAYLKSFLPLQDTTGGVSDVWGGLTNKVASLFRAGRGSRKSAAAATALLADEQQQQQQPLVLYSYEGNQFCRLVREVLTELDIVYELRNAGKESPRRMELIQITGGSSQCPYLVDPNTGVSMAESADIIDYLYQTYAKWTPPSELLGWTSENIMSLVKPVFGQLAMIQAGSLQDDKTLFESEIGVFRSSIENIVYQYPVVIYTYEWSPFSTEAKSLLDSLNIPYQEISLGKEWIPGLISTDGAKTRAALYQLTGQSSLPHIFVGGQSVGGLYSGQPGLVPSLEDGSFISAVSVAMQDTNQNA